MIPQVHDEEIQHEEHVPSPRQEKHTPRPVSWWQNRDLLLNIFMIVDPNHPNWPAIRLRIFGVVDPFAGGFVVAAIWAAGRLSSVWLLALLLGLSAFVGAFLLRSWWALLVAPCAVIIGAVLPGQFELDLFLLAFALPAFLGAALGSALIKHKGVSY
jgi:hypothetical protein